MKPVHAKRLLKLADFLEKLPRKRFDYATWVGDTWDGTPLQSESCGTTACALGWAATMPLFRRLGASLKKYTDYEGGFVCFKGRSRMHCFLFTGGAGKYGETPMPDSVTPKQAAKHIRNFVAARSK